MLFVFVLKNLYLWQDKEVIFLYYHLEVVSFFLELQVIWNELHNLMGKFHLFPYGYTDYRSLSFLLSFSFIDTTHPSLYYFPCIRI